MKLRQNINAFIRQGEQKGYVAECIEISVVTQGDTLDEVAKNLTEAVTLHLEDEDPAEFGLVAKPTIILTFDRKIALWKNCLLSKNCCLKATLKVHWLSLKNSKK